ncbi:MAG: 6-bladed beta-propeller [Actinobacteria bacterium]|nr:6-bladed beta-propeller [Actinomycetota bacterium]
MTKIGKRIVLVMIGLVVLSASVGVATYIYLTSDLELPSGHAEATPRYSYSITGTGKTMLKEPLSAAVVGGRVFVADGATGKVVIFLLNGTPLRSFKLLPEVESAKPLMVAGDSEGRAYVTVTVGSVNKIMVYDEDGGFLYAFPDGVAKGFGAPIALVKPMGLFVTDDRLYVTDIGDHTVKIFSSNGQFLRKFGGWGHAHGQFAYPNGVAVDESGWIYVTDSNNARVEVYDQEGRYRSSLTPAGNALFSLPRGIAVDRMGRIHVVDSFGHKVFVFDKHGFPLQAKGDQGNAVNDFYYPNGITIDSHERAFIADRQNGRIAVWQIN